jgi:hypothetical protein
LDITLDTLRAAEVSLGNLKSSPLKRADNVALTQGAGFLSAEWHAKVTGGNESVVAEFLEREKADQRVPYLMLGEYFDPVRVAQLCLIAGSALRRAWSVFSSGETPRFVQSQQTGSRLDLAGEMLEERVARFAKSGSDNAVLESPDLFSILSPRLAEFLNSVRADFADAFAQPFEASFEIRPQFIDFRPDYSLRHMDTQLDGWQLTLN